MPTTNDDFRSKAARNSQPPADALIITTFKDLHRLVTDFFKPTSTMGLLILLGRPGISKSHSAKEHIKKDESLYKLIKGAVSAPKAYEKIWECSGRPTDDSVPRKGHHKTIILDDAESLAGTSEGRVLLRSLTETDKVKQVGWEKQASWLEHKGIPSSFQTKSRVLIIANRFNWGKEAETAAILDRSHFYYFNPSSLEVHIMVGGWFWDQEIYDYVGSKLNILPNLSIRPYILADELKIQGSAWKPTIDRFTYHDQSQTYIDISRNKKFKTETAKIEEFMRLTGSCRKTWYNLKTYVETTGYQYEPIHAPKIKLKGKRPPKD